MQFDHSPCQENSHQKSQKDTGSKISPDELQRMIDMAKLSAMRNHFLRNHPEWRERGKKEPFPPEMETEWHEHLKRRKNENKDF